MLNKYKANCGYCGWYCEGYWMWVQPFIKDHVESCKEYDIKLYNKTQTGFDYAEDTEKYLCKIKYNAWFDENKKEAEKSVIN